MYKIKMTFTSSGLPFLGEFLGDSKNKDDASR
jgi:hypothetical protein